MRLVTAIRIGVALSAPVVFLGIAWSVVGYLSQGAGGAALAGVAAVFFGVMALAVIWLGVFVVIVIQKGVRVLGDGRHS
jgi:hypothetical protein